MFVHELTGLLYLTTLGSASIQCLRSLAYGLFICPPNQTRELHYLTYTLMTAPAIFGLSNTRWVDNVARGPLENQMMGGVVKYLSRTINGFSWDLMENAC